MESVIVQRPATPEDRAPESWGLGPGDEMRFGRGGAGSDVEVALHDPGVPRVAGEIAAADPHLDPTRPRDGERTVRSFSLDESAKYFLVLVALCEPRLRAPSTTSVPSLGAVVQRLRDVPGCEELTRTAVEFHVEYLARHKLRVRERERDHRDSDEQDRLAHRRQALVSLALRFGLVDADHLGLLPPRPSRGARERS
jgi:hypothetical protein